MQFAQHGTILEVVAGTDPNVAVRISCMELALTPVFDELLNGMTRSGGLEDDIAGRIVPSRIGYGVVVVVEHEQVPGERTSLVFPTIMIMGQSE